MTGYSTPEEAARGDIPQSHAKVLGVAHSPSGKHAIVLVEVSEHPPSERFEMACVRRRSRWMPMAGSSRPGETWFENEKVTTSWDEAPAGPRSLSADWLRIRFRERVGRRLLTHRLGRWITRARTSWSESFTLEAIGGSYAANIVERGGLAPPAELRGPAGDAFAHEYFVRGDTAFLAGLSRAAKDDDEIKASVDSSQGPDELDHEVRRRTAERILLRFHEWQEAQRHASPDS